MTLTAEQVHAERVAALLAERFGLQEQLELERHPNPLLRARRAALLAATKETTWHQS